MKDFSNIDLSLNPMKMPTVKGRFGIKNLSDNAFPMYVTAFKEGSEILIREGHVFTLDYPYVILNTQFRTRFKQLLKFTADKKISLHATVCSQGMTASQMDTVLQNPSKLLPIDTSIYITLTFYETAIQDTPFKEWVNLQKILFKDGTLPFNNNITSSIYVKVNSKSNLEDITDFLLGSIKHNKGLILLEKYGNYKEGEVPVEQTNAVKLTSTEEVWGSIRKISVSTKYLPGNTLTMADNILIQFGEIELNYDLSKESFMLRGFLAQYANKMVNAKIKTRNLYLPSQIQVLKLLDLNY